MDRRNFLTRATAGIALAGMAANGRAAGANDRIIVGIIGIHDRGMDLAELLAKASNVEVRYLADVDATLFAKRAAYIESLGGKAPKCVQDLRTILDNPEVNAVAIATPDHWHALATVWACQAGKDVYVEKPTSHSVWESRKMIEAARKYQRVVQVGTQNRSAEYIQDALARIRAGELGDIHFVRVLNSKMREDIGRVADSAAPAGLDYDRWLGPAPLRPFNLNRFHYNWHWFWDYGGGDAANDGVHQIDLARWMTGRALPHHVSSTGAKMYFQDDRETPDTQLTSWEYDGLAIAFEQTLWTPYMKKLPVELRDSGNMPDWPFAGTRIELYGTKGFMYLGRMGDGWKTCDADGKTVDEKPGKFVATNIAHMNNFLECIRTRATPNADIEEGHRSTLLAHYGNIACRVGRRLHIAPDTEQILDDAEAQALTRRTYREPYVVPETV